MRERGPCSPPWAAGTGGPEAGGDGRAPRGGAAPRVPGHGRAAAALPRCRWARGSGVAEATAVTVTTELIMSGLWLTRARRCTGLRRRGLPLPEGVRSALPAPQPGWVDS